MRKYYFPLGVLQPPLFCVAAASFHVYSSRRERIKRERGGGREEGESEREGGRESNHGGVFSFESRVYHSSSLSTHQCNVREVAGGA